MWEKCTICNGKGLDPNYFIINNNTPKCPVCKGKRIINTLTGNPPVDDVIETETSNINKVKYRGGLDKKHLMNTKNPILKGCRNKECFCTGECKKIVGYKEDYKKNSLSASDFAKLFYGTFKGDSGPR